MFGREKPRPIVNNEDVDLERRKFVKLAAIGAGVLAAGGGAHAIKKLMQDPAAVEAAKKIDPDYSDYSYDSNDDYTSDYSDGYTSDSYDLGRDVHTDYGDKDPEKQSDKK